MTDVQFIILG